MSETWVEVVPTDPETAPESIRATQVKAVAAAIPLVTADWGAAGFEPTVAQLAECLPDYAVLPRWNCERALAAIRGEELAAPAVTEETRAAARRDPLKQQRCRPGRLARKGRAA